MTFQQIQYLLEVNKTKSISRAAKNLFVTSSSVSIAIHSLENELGYPLFNRSQRGITPTQKGTAVISRAKQIYETYQEINDLDLDPHTDIRISTCSYAPINNALVRLINEYRERNDINFSMCSYSVPEIINKLLTNELDCGIIFNFEPRLHILESKLKAKNLHWKKLQSLPVYFIIGKGHPLYDKENPKPSDFENHIILDGTQRALERSDYLRGLMTIRSKNVLVVSRAVVRYELLSMGYGYTICNKPTDDIIQQYGLRCIPIEGAAYALLLITNPAQKHPPEIERFLDILDEELEKS